jgi:tetratricopeptide (TPR) repeat protein
LLFGAGLANHQVLLLCAPAFAVYVLAIGGIRFRAWTMHLITLVLALAGLAVYFYLPVRSMANPPMDWGNPETWPAFYDVVTRAQYQFIITDGPRSWPRFIDQSETFASIYLAQFTPGVGLLAPFGVFVLWKRSFRALSVMLLLAWLGTVIGGILIPNFGPDRLSLWLNTTYWIPAYQISAICIGAAIAGICASIQRRLVRIFVLTGLLVAAVGAPLLANYAHNDKSRFYLASDYARNILATLAPGAIYFGDSDLSLFPVMYYQIVEHMRTDVLIANPYGYPTENLYRDMPEELRAGFRKPIPTEDDEQLIFEWLVKTSGRPVYTTAQRRGEGIVAYNEGLLYRYAPASTPVDPGSSWDRYTWHSLDESAFGDDWSAEVVLSEYYFARGRADFDAGRRASGLNAFERAANIARANKEMLNNLGCAVASYGLLDDAIRYFEAACALDPEFHMARLNLGRAYIKKHDYTRAKAETDRVLVTAPNDPAAKMLSDYCADRIKAGA